jgi:hypothetical protein
MPFAWRGWAGHCRATGESDFAHLPGFGELVKRALRGPFSLEEVLLDEVDRRCSLTLSPLRDSTAYHDDEQDDLRDDEQDECERTVDEGVHDNEREGHDFLLARLPVNAIRTSRGTSLAIWQGVVLGVDAEFLIAADHRPTDGHERREGRAEGNAHEA